MIHLREISLDRDALAHRAGAGEAGATRPVGFPFGIPALREFGSLQFETPITFFVGENGSGKSTLLEALAWAVEATAAGSESLEEDASLQAVQPLGDCLRTVWNRRTRRGFFLRAEDFFGHVKRVNASLAHHRAEFERLRAENPNTPAGELARIGEPHAGSVRGLEARYGEDADARSHGEQFLAFFQARLVPDGLYLLDEPEAPLSPLRQLALLSVLKEFSQERRCQFVIATHSPLLLAMPGATILSFDASPIRAERYDDLEHVRLTRDFLRDPDAFLRHL